MDVKMALYRECFFTNLYKIMVKKVTFIDFTGGDRPNRPSLYPPLLSEMSTDQDWVGLQFFWTLAD